MKVVLPILLALLSLSMQGQISILFVDDSDDTFMNSENLQMAFVDAGVAFTLFDAQGMEQGPDLATMSQYDLVVWHTSSQGVDLYVWNGLDEINGQLTSYLDGGGKLWLIGNDFFYDLDLSTPHSFMAGDFAYDYLGIESFDIETYNDDGNTGVPQVDPAAGQPIPGLMTLDWQFSTLWYADGVTPRAETQAIYEMGDASYTFAGTAAATLYDNGTFQVLTYYFDLALASSATLMSENVAAVVAYFESTLVSTGEPAWSESLQVSPNPAADQLTVDFTLDAPATTNVWITDLFGRRLGELATDEDLIAGPHQLTWQVPAQASNGLYLLLLEIDGRRISRRVTVQR